MAADDLNRVVIHCKGLLFDEHGRLLLVRQAERIGTFWNAPGGRMEDGDSPESCLRREVREETGLTVESARPVYSHAVVSPGVTDVYLGFHVTAYSGELGVDTAQTEIEQQEIIEVRYVAQQEKLSDLLFPPRLWEVATACLNGGVASLQYLGTEELAENYE